MYKDMQGVHIGEDSEDLLETLSELTGSGEQQILLEHGGMPTPEGVEEDLSYALSSKSPLSTSKFLEFIPVPDELASYSHKIKFAKAIESTPLRMLKIRDVLSDLAIWRFEISSHWVPPLSEGYDGFRFKSDYAIRQRYERGVRNGWDYCKTFSDVLSFRLKLREYPKVLPTYFKVDDCRMGGYVPEGYSDNGYRGMHLFFQLSPQHYPIEIQMWSAGDWNFNLWCQTKGVFFMDPKIGRTLREMYQAGKVHDFDQFKKELIKLEVGGA